MINTSIISRKSQIESSIKDRKNYKYPMDAWGIIASFFLITIVAARVGLGAVLNLLFPLGSLVVGFYLFTRYPNLYLGFTWWLWFTTPFLRRLSDYWSAYVEPSPILLAPFLVTGLTILTVIKELPKAHRTGSLPFVFALTGVTYGFCIGLANRSLYGSGFPVSLIQSFLEWIVPVTFGWHLFIRWRDYTQYRQLTQQVFTWGLLVMGVYGIWQYLALPEWDHYWLMQSGLFSSQGLPDEFGGIRVWSTMHSGEPFAAYLAGGLLLLLSYRNPITLPASLASLMSLLLTTVRSSWISFFIGLVSLFSFLKPNFQIRLILLAITISLSIIPVITSETFSGDVVSRFISLSNLADDNSTEARTQTYTELLGPALNSLIGRGLGLGVGDSAILSTLFQIGWIGVFFYIGGMSLLLSKLFIGSSSMSNDSFAMAARAIILGSLIRAPVNSIFVGPGGFLLWAFIGLGMAKVNQEIRLNSDLKVNSKF